jgi:signal transduction histidine kinase
MNPLNVLSIKARIILATTAVLGVVFVVFSLVIYQRARGAYYDRLDARLVGYTEKLRGEVEEQYYEKRLPDVTELRELKYEGLSGSYFRLSDQTGKSIYADSILAGEPQKPWTSIAPHQFTFEDNTIGSVRYRTLWARVEAGDQDRFSVQVAVPLTELEASLGLLQLLFLIGVPLALTISGLAVYAIVLAAFRPLSSMVRTSGRISASNLSERIPVPRNRDEVFTLAMTLNTMMERIEKAFRSQKQFVADASHEIRTPLSIMRSELEYAQRQAEGDSTKESLHAALEEVDRLKNLSDDLLLLAKLDSSSLTLNIAAVRMDELLADCVKKMKAIADIRNITLLLTVHDVVEIEADEEKLRSAMLNLVDNAIKYSREGGNVEIKTCANDRDVEVTVHDEGEGIAEEEIQNVFKRFHRSSTSQSRHDGSGLGLAIVRGIVELHGGTVTASSKPGEGSVFTVRIPKRDQR